MTDPLLTGYLATVAAELTIGVINALTKKTKQQFESPARQQALARCYQTGSVALLPQADPDREILLPV
ncbi:MAG: hypothetical protein GY796_14275, partial [Chloroflexi bacterium]|nr:hypothetical protein [Chloroflexota bacterium]